MGKRQIPWNKYEAVVLLQGFLRAKNGKLSRIDAIKEVSEQLRAMAINSGIEIDETYRNTNGIKFQMHSMESAYCGLTIIKPATLLFREIVAMNSEDVLQLLLDAYFLIYGSGETNEREEATEMARAMNALTKKLQETLSKVAPHDSAGVSAEELASMLKEPLYKVRYLLDISEWAINNGRRYVLAENHNVFEPSSENAVQTKRATSTKLEKFQSLMMRVAGPQTSGVTVMYLIFALKCSESEVLELIKQSDWVEKCGDKYRCTSQIPKAKTQTRPNAVVEPVVERELNGSNDSGLARLRSIMLLFAPANSSGVTKEYLAAALGCSQDKIAELIGSVDWIEKIGDRYRLLNQASKQNVSTNKQKNPSNKTDAERVVSHEKKEATNIKQRKDDFVSAAMRTKTEARETPDKKAESTKKMFDEDNFFDYIRTSRDGELFNKYPVLFKRIFTALKGSNVPSSVGRVYDATKRISRIEAVQEILDGASWSQKKDSLYSFVPRDGVARVTQNQTSDTSTTTISSPHTLTIDFEKIGDLSFTKPESYRYFEIQRAGFRSWKDLYADFMGCFYEDYPHLLYHGAKFNRKENARPDVVDKAYRNSLVAPRDIPGSNLCVETNFDVTDIVRQLKMLLDMGNLDYDCLTITYYPKTDAPTITEQPKGSARATTTTSSAEQKQFADWLRSIGTVEANVKNFVAAVTLTEKYAKDLKCTHTCFWGDDPTETKLAYNEIFTNSKFVSFNQKKYSVFSRALRKYMEFQRERQQKQTAAPEQVKIVEKPPVVEAKPTVQIPKPVEEIHSLLLEEYPNGFRLNSSLEMKKFKKKYESKYGAAPSLTDEQIDWTIRKCGIIHDNRLYCPERMLDDNTKEKLEKYIQDSFQSGKKCLFFEALFSVFSELFLDHNIYNADMLKTYLQSVYRGRYYFFNSYFSTDQNATSDPTEEIRNCMVEYGKPIGYEELFKLLPHIPDEKIRFTLNTTKEFISNGRKQYFHIDVFQISDDELNDVVGIIHLLIQQNKYISGNELVAAIRAKIPYVLEANAGIADIGIRNALAQLLADRFSFKGNIISALGVEIEMRDVFSEFSNNTPNFTMDELSKLASDLNTTIYFDYVYKNAVRISQDNFVRKEQISFDVQRIDQIIDTFCPGKYISVQDITNFVAFPDCGFPWNSFLLESFVATHSNRYCLIHNTFGIKSVSGGIVKRSSGIDSLDKLVTLVLADSNCQLKKEPALEYLYDYGYLGQRRYSTIEKVLIDAQTIRNKRGM